MPDGNTQRLREHAACILQHVFASAARHDPMQLEIAATLERLDSPQALQQMLSTLIGWANGIVGEKLALLDRDLAALGLVTLSQSRGDDRQTVFRILERGRIESRDEHRVASAFADLGGPIGPSTNQRGRVLELLNGYSEGDQGSADAAPLALAWRAAARDLDIRFQSPYQLSTQDQPGIWCCGLLPDFGGTKGTVILGRFSSSVAESLAEEQGYYTSGLNPLYYEYYERAHFEETLNDWGWFGEAEMSPPWFRGGFGRHGGPEAA